MDFEARDGEYLEEGLAIEVDLVEVGVFLVADAGVCESTWAGKYPLEVMSPLESACSLLLRFTPWMRMMSPHFRALPESDIYLNKL